MEYDLCDICGRPVGSNGEISPESGYTCGKKCKRIALKKDDVADVAERVWDRSREG